MRQGSIVSKKIRIRFCELGSSIQIQTSGGITTAFCFHDTVSKLFQFYVHFYGDWKEINANVLVPLRSYELSSWAPSVLIPETKFNPEVHESNLYKRVNLHPYKFTRYLPGLFPTLL